MIWIYVLALQDITYLTMGKSFNLSEAPFTITAMKIIILIFCCLLRQALRVLIVYCFVELWAPLNLELVWHHGHCCAHWSALVCFMGSATPLEEDGKTGGKVTFWHVFIPISPHWMSKFVEQQPNVASEQLPAGGWIPLGCKVNDQKQTNCKIFQTHIKFRRLPSHKFCCVSNKD